MSLETRAWTLAALLLVCVAACRGKDDGGGGAEPSPSPVPSPTPTAFASLDGNVKFKRAARIRNDFAAALSLAPDELCNELGNFSCTDLVHLVSLGAVEPYGVGVYEPPDATAGNAPLIVERVALAGCITRVDRDALDPASGVIFGGVFQDADPAMSAAERAAAPAAVEALYRAALRRDAEASERDRLVAMYDEVVAGGSTSPARDWAVLSCFAVLTTAESVFY